MKASLARPWPRFWAWAAPLASGLICLSMLWLQGEQRLTLQSAEVSLDQYRQAEFDLSRGFLHAVMEGDSAFSHSEGLVLLEQALRELRRESHLSGSPQSRRALERFEEKSHEFRHLLNDWRSSAGNADAALETRLRVAFHQLDLEARSVDRAYREEFRQLSATLERRYRALMSLSMVLLTGLCVGVALASRRELLMLRALASSEEQLLQLNRVYAFLSEFNQAVVRLTDRDELLAAACRFAVERAGLSCAWVALRCEDGLELKCCWPADEARAEHCRQLLQPPRRWLELALGSGRPSCHRLGDDREPRSTPGFQALGEGGVGIFPLLQETESLGVLVLHSAEPGFFGEAEVRLLEEVACDLSFALEFLRGEQQRKRAEEQLRQSEDRLRQSQKMEGIGQLAGGVAHDFNNILSVILMQTELLSLEPGVQPEVAEGLQVIRGASERAADLTRQLLVFSRRQVMKMTLLDLNESVMSVAKMLQRLIGEDIRLELNLLEQPLTILADSGMMGQVLMNLAINARDAMPEGGSLELSTSLCPAAQLREGTAPPGEPPTDYALLSVRDTGEGISDEIRPHIFEPFFTTKAVGKGTGLGLATVFGIVQQHQGWIDLDSRPGGGTHFRIYLPLQAATAAARPVAGGAAVGGNERVLVVEDDEGIRRLTRRTLEHAGYAVVEAEDGPSAIRCFDSLPVGSVQLVISDIVMPGGMNGLQLAERLREKDPELPVLFTSGYESSMAGQSLEAGFARNFLAKPYAPGQLLESVRGALSQRPVVS